MILYYVPIYFWLIPFLTLAVGGVLLGIYREAKLDKSPTWRFTSGWIATALVVPGLILGAAYLGNTHVAQETKAQKIAINRASAVGTMIQMLQVTNVAKATSPSVGIWQRPALADVALSSEFGSITDHADELSRGEKVSFKSSSGKEVTVHLVASDKSASAFDAVVTVDGKQVKDDLLIALESSTHVKWGTDRDWVNDYPDQVDTSFPTKS